MALNEPYDGNMKGIDSINYQCYKEAMNEGINGVFRAFLSTWGMNLNDLVRNQQDTIVNLYNRTLFTTWADVFKTSSKIFSKSNALLGNTSALYSFNGKNVIMDDNW